MAFVFYNNNPNGNYVGDCSIRAIAKALGKTWEDAYIALCAEGLMYHDMPSSPYVIGMYLKKQGYERKMIPNICPDCTTLRAFVEDHKTGTFIIVTDGHIVTAIDGDYYDIWDSGDEIVLYYYMEEM